MIKNSKIVTENNIFEGEIGVENGRIVQLARSISSSADRKIDARGLLVLPGLVDTHTHMEMPAGQRREKSCNGIFQVCDVDCNHPIRAVVMI